MRVLLVVSDLFFGEPMGALQIGAVLKGKGHAVSLLALCRTSLSERLAAWQPDVIAYSAMSPDVPIMRDADQIVRQWATSSRKRVLRVMGGPHPTYFPEVCEEFELDAVCVGEGDHALPRLIERFARRGSFSGIANILPRGETLHNMEKELVLDLDSLPFPDRDLYYNEVPWYRHLALRGFMAGRGCPYECTYCFNHAFKAMFRSCGPILRRRRVETVLCEIKEVIKRYPPVHLIKISDDTFAHRVDDWLIDFLARYKNEIGLPFYCLMRSNTLTEDMARRLREAGCVSIGMSVESGSEEIRNHLLKRNLTDEMVVNSFRYAHAQGIRTYGNTLLALPGTKAEDDLQSFRFVKKLGMTVPTFAVFSPYPRTRLKEFADELHVLPDGFAFDNYAFSGSPLTCFTPSEKRMQVNLAYLGTLLCDLPDFLMPLMLWSLRLPLGFVYKRIGYAYMVMKTGYYIFPRVWPRHPASLFTLFFFAMRFFVKPKCRSIEKAPTQWKQNESAS